MIDDPYRDPCERGCPVFPAKRYRIRYADGTELVTYLCAECEACRIYQEDFRQVVSKTEIEPVPYEDDLPF